ncbi:acid protease [Thozetella sp. PMI_491]|nr:acid protease [Thozetella sp. PMI_491]
MWPCLFLILVFPFTSAVSLPWSSPGRNGVFSVSKASKPNYKSNGPAEYLRALAKWNMNVPTSLAGFVSNKGEVGGIAATNQTDDREYLSSIGIGNPPQECQLDLDTGSSDFWVITSNTQTFDAGVGNREIWYPENSSTAERVNSSHWEIMYGDGSYAYGQAWKDTIRFANITIDDVIVEDASFVSPTILSDENLSGVLGLAVGLRSQVRPIQPTLLDKLRPMLDRDLFTVDLKYHAEGLYEFGHVDDSKYTGDLHWVDLVPNATYWQFSITGVNVGDSNLWYLSQWSAIADTGTTLLLLPSKIVELYYDSVPAAVLNATVGGWTYPCDADLPVFRLGFDNGYHVSVPGTYMTFMEVEPGSGVCYGGLQSSLGQPFGILGDVFLKACFAAFDLGGKRVGFADKELAED